jgi:hypothetical protein
MTLQRRFPALTAAAACLLTLVGGCEDNAARQRAAAQEAIESAGRELEFALVAATLPGEEGFEKARGTLQGIVTSLTRLNGADQGQQVAADHLLAASHIRLAGMRLVEAEELELQARGRRAQLHSQLDAALRLDSLASSHARLNSDESRAHLEDVRDVSTDRLERHSARLAELDGPIAERQARNREDGTEAARLDGEADELRREAARRGHAEGLNTYEEAIRLERKADEHEYFIALRQNELEYEYLPQHGLAERRADAARTMLRTVSSTEESLDEQDVARETEVQATRELIDGYRERIEAGLAELNATTEGDLATRYTEALDHLQKTRQSAERTVNRSGREGKDTARLTLARTLEATARVHATQAIGLQGQRTLLARLADAGDAVGDNARYRSELSETTQAAEAAVEQAKAALTEARDTLNNVSGREVKPHVTEFVAGLDRHIAALSGETAPETPRRPGRRGTAGGDAAASGGKGFASADEIVELMRGSGDDDMDAALRVMDAIHTPSATSRKMVAGMRSVMEPMAAFMNAVTDAFGPEALEQMQGGPGMSSMAPTYEDIEVTERTDEKVVVQFTEDDGTPTTLDLVKIGDQWFIDGDSMVATMSEEEIGMMELAAAMVSGMFGGLTERIKSGEFATMEEFEQAMMQEMMGGMGGGPEGMPPPGQPGLAPGQP